MSQGTSAGALVSRRRVRGEGLDLAVFEGGVPGAPTILLVHGYPDHHVVWDRVAAMLCDRFHVIAYDVRGAGESDVPSSRDGYAIESLAADLDAVIEATSGGRPAHVVGHDWGSIQSWEAVTDDRIARRIASFTTISGPCLDRVRGVVREALATRSIAPLLSQAARSWYMAFFQIPGAAESLWRAGIASRLPRVLEKTEGVKDASPVHTEDGVRGLELYRANVARRLRAPRERATSVPVQLLIPLGDRYVTPDLARAAARFVPDLTVHEIDGGHWVIRSAPDLIARLIERHVSATESRAR